VLRQLNVIRVTSLEELLTTGAVLGYSRWPRGRRMGVLTLSGGSCDIIADAASAHGVAIPDFSAQTQAAIAALLPSFARPHNPLDVTGFGTLANLSGKKGPLQAVDHALDIAVQDQNLDFVLFSGVVLPEARPPDTEAARTLEARVGWLAMRMGSAPIPVIPVASTCVNVSDYGRGLRGLAGSADEAVEIARQVGLPVALKVCSAQIAHKSDIGGVVLGLGSEAEVRAGYEKVSAAGMAVPAASVEGVLVTPMRTGGAELLAGVTVDPAFGPVLAVGLGGIWVEILGDTSLRLLPVDAAEVRRMLGELRGLPLLQGARGTRPADLDAVAKAIARLGEAALGLGGTLRAMEVNPLWVNGDQVEALDVLVITEVRDQP